MTTIGPPYPAPTPIVPADAGGVARGGEILAAGGIVAVASETVYGLAADAANGEAVARIYAAKGRPSFNPLICHVSGMAMAQQIAEVGPVAQRLAAHFWPGPLTMVLPVREGAALSSLVTAGLPTVAVRHPAHPAMLALIAAAGGPLAAPSANASGTISPTRADHVAASLGGRIDLILDAGATPQGIESTIVKVADDGLILLRPGPITAEALATASGLPVRAVEPLHAIEAPGQLASHYAPHKPVRLHASEAMDGEFLIGFGPMACDANLSEAADLTQAAANLFALMHEADASCATRIAIADIPDEGLGVAINDRLRRAAA